MTTVGNEAALTGIRPLEHTGERPARLWYVENMRVVLICVVILVHGAITYNGMGVRLWYYMEKPTSGAAGTGLTLFARINQGWVMGAFFLLSGYFSPASYDRKGPGAFIRSRLVRLGIPLLVYYFVLAPLICFGCLAYFGASAYVFAAPVKFYLATIGSGPLWFLLALLIFDVSYAGLRLAAGPRRSRTPDRRPFTRAAVIVFAAVLALATYAIRLVLPLDRTLPVLGFPSAAYLPQYVAFFALGAMAYRRDWFTTTPARMGGFGLGLAAAASVLLLPAALAGGDKAFLGHGTVSSLLYAMWDSAFAIGIFLALFVLFRRWFNAQGRLGRYLSTHVFTVYVIHALVVTAVGLVLSAAPLPTLAKFAIAVVVAVPTCFVLAGPVRWFPTLLRLVAHPGLRRRAGAVPAVAGQLAPAPEQVTGPVGHEVRDAG